MTPARLHPDDLAALADLVAARLVERLHERDAAARAPVVGDMLTTTEAARRLSMTAATVRAHADELGAVRFGSGPKPRLMIPAANVEALATARREGKRSDPPDPPRRRRKSNDRRATTASGCPLLPVGGPSA